MAHPKKNVRSLWGERIDNLPASVVLCLVQMWATTSYLEDWKVRWLLVGGGRWAGLTGKVLGRGGARGE